MRARFTPGVSSDVSLDSSNKQERKMRQMPGILITAGKAAAIITLCVVLIYTGIFIAGKSNTKTPAAVLPGQNVPATLSESEVKSLVAKVGKHLILPGDTPQIVAIANVDQLKIDQPFFRSAQNGDQLLVYTSKVILYRPSTDQIVDIAQIRTTPVVTPVASVSAAPFSATSTLTPSPTKPAVYATWTPTPTAQ